MLNIYKSLTEPFCRSNVDESTAGLVEFEKQKVQKQLLDEEEKCLQSLRLSAAEKDITYEWYKNRVDNRLDGTCKWFLTNPKYRDWLKEESGVLLVTADPGCGKSVLAKYLIDVDLPQSEAICYFFFKDNDQNTVRQALCAILHQLFSQRRSLIRHAIAEYKKEGDHLKNVTASLWKILEAAGKDAEAGRMVILLDALDECAESDFEELIQGLNTCVGGSVKVLATSRPYEQILAKFRGLLDKFPLIRIPGEKEDRVISQEVNHVIKHRVGQLAKEKELGQNIKDHLEQHLLKSQHRTYLWVYLVFEHLKETNFEKTEEDIIETISTLPEGVDEAYGKILSKPKDTEKLRKALKLILAASRPLTLTEMNIAMKTNLSSKGKLKLSSAEDFALYIRELCGLFISIYNGGVYFLHQTAREFLLADASIAAKQKGWKHSITIIDAHKLLAEVCVGYLKLFNSDDPLGAKERDLLDYSAGNWATHFREGHIDADSMVSAAVNVCEGAQCYSTWFPIFWKTTGWQSTNFEPLLIAAYFGLESVVVWFLDKNANIEMKDIGYGQTPLSWAARNGHKAVVKVLLNKNANIETKNIENSRILLSWAAGNGHKAVVKVLLNKNTNIKTQDISYIGNGRIPLIRAIQNGHEAVVKVLFNKNANIETQNTSYIGYGRTLLIQAAQNSYKAVVKILLNKNANIETRDTSYGQTPLSWAAQNGHEAVVKVLLNKNANIETRDISYSQTLLS